MVTRIRRGLEKTVEFLRRKLEVWFILLIILAMGGFGLVVLERIESTQVALCRNAYASAATKDKFVDAVVTGGADPNGGFVQELRRYVQEERDQLKGDCARQSVASTQEPFEETLD